MPTMYALPSLTVWNNNGTTGWSDTSGGASNGSRPSAATDVVFDANSGSSRTITFFDGLSSGLIPCKSITTLASAPMTFAGAVPLNPRGDVDLTGSLGTMTITFGGSNTINLIVPPNLVTYLSPAGPPVILQSDLVIAGAIYFNAGLGGSFNANNFNVTCSTVTSAGGGYTLTMGSGTWTLNGTGVVWDAPGFSTFNCGTSTIKLTGDTSSSQIVFEGYSKTYYNFWNATTGNNYAVQISGSNAFNTIKIDAGRKQKFQTSTTQTVSNFIADGTASPITISSTSPGAMANLTKSGGGAVYLDYCTITDIAVLSTTWYARNSTDGGNNLRITFIPRNSAFMHFLG